MENSCYLTCLQKYIFLYKNTFSYDIPCASEDYWGSLIAKWNTRLQQIHNLFESKIKSTSVDLVLLGSFLVQSAVNQH